MASLDQSGQEIVKNARFRSYSLACLFFFDLLDASKAVKKKNQKRKNARITEDFTKCQSVFNVRLNKHWKLSDKVVWKNTHRENKTKTIAITILETDEVKLHNKERKWCNIKFWTNKRVKVMVTPFHKISRKYFQKTNFKVSFSHDNIIFFLLILISVTCILNTIIHTTKTEITLILWL